MAKKGGTRRFGSGSPRYAHPTVTHFQRADEHTSWEFCRPLPETSEVVMQQVAVMTWRCACGKVYVAVDG